jgi:excisionase family DNA binding protein
MPGKLLNLKEAGEILGVTDRTVQNIIMRGELRGFQVGERWRVEESEIAAFIERQKEKAATLEARQPGVFTLIAEAFAHLPKDEERIELEQWIIDTLLSNEDLMLKFEGNKLAFDSLKLAQLRAHEQVEAQ